MDYLVMIEELTVALAAQSWKWTVSSIDDTLHALGAAATDSIGSRRSYSFSDYPDADLYLNDDVPMAIEFVCDAFVDVDSLTDLQYDDKVDEFYDKFESATLVMRAILGPPQFSDGAAAKGFPEDQDAVWVSLWNLPTCRLMLQQQHEDRELPFRISIVLAPLL